MYIFHFSLLTDMRFKRNPGVLYFPNRHSIDVVVVDNRNTTAPVQHPLAFSTSVQHIAIMCSLSMDQQTQIYSFPLVEVQLNMYLF